MFTALLFLANRKDTVYSFILVCLVHETGHLLTMMIFGVKIKKLIFSGFGICIETEKSGIVPVCRSIGVLLSGPAANFLMYFLLRVSGVHTQTEVLSLFMGIYNLLPYQQLDGGAVLELLITGSVYERELRILLKIVRLGIIIFSAVLTALGGFGYIPLFAAAVLLYYNEA